MPTLPQAENAIQNLITALEGISTKNGYWFNIRNVYRAPTTLPESVSHPFIAVFEEASTIVNQTNVEDLETLNVHIDVWEQTSQDLGTTAMKLRQDVEKALMANTRRGGYAQSTRMKSYDIVYLTDEQGSYVGVAMEWELIIRYTRGSP